MSEKKLYINYFFLFITAILWGSTFIFQKAAMETMNPYFYSSVRFFVGSFSLIPIILFLNRKQLFSKINHKNYWYGGINFNFFKIFFQREMLISGFIAGSIIALAINLQQIALHYTQVAKVGFITSFYIIIVPFIEFFLGKKLSIRIFFACIVAITGFFFLSYKQSISGFGFGDLITLLSSFFWAMHIVYLGHCSKKLDNFIFSFLQFFFCATLTLFFIFLIKINISWEQIRATWLEIFYGGVVSVGIGFTLQVLGQRKIQTYLAAMIISLEAVFAAIFEVLILGIFLSPLEVLGCLLLFVAVIYSQFYQRKIRLEIIN